MFEVLDIDSIDLAKNYQLTFYNLQLQQVQKIPYIKVNEWKFYNTDGQLWKKVNYKQNKIPLSTSIVMLDPEKIDQTRLVINLKERLDEWED